MTQEQVVVRKHDGERVTPTFLKALKDVLPADQCKVKYSFGLAKYVKGQSKTVEWQWDKPITIHVDISYMTVKDLVKGLDLPSIPVRLQKYIRGQGKDYAMAFFKEYNGKVILYSEVDTGPMSDPTDTVEAIEAKIAALKAQLEEKKG